MSTAHWIQSSLEIIFGIALIVGFIYEPVVAKWEQKQKEKVLKALKKRKEHRL